MNKTIQSLINSRPWIAHIDDERDIGNSIIVTLADGWHFIDGDREGVRGFDSFAEVKTDTKRSNVSQ
jgi:hypothetical protein